MSEQKRLQMQFWGVRGAIPVPSPEMTGLGGNTACLEVRLPEGGILIFDCGSGARPLGHALQSESGGRPLSLHVFLTHFHWDHIQGVPFFDPLYTARNEITFCSFPPPAQLHDILERQMAPPFYPVTLDFMPARKNFVSLAADPLRLHDARVTSFPLHHPQHAFGYRVDAGGASLVFATDHEHGDRAIDLGLRRAAEGADVLIYDSQFTPEEYARKRGWGHSTWLEATRVARDCGVKRLILFHHDPYHSDQFMHQVLSEARTHFAATELAREGAQASL